MSQFYPAGYGLVYRVFPVVAEEGGWLHSGLGPARSPYFGQAISGNGDFGQTAAKHFNVASKQSQKASMV
jgi:hypothetical protein